MIIIRVALTLYLRESFNSILVIVYNVSEDFSSVKKFECLE